MEHLSHPTLCLVRRQNWRWREEYVGAYIRRPTVTGLVSDLRFVNCHAIVYAIEAVDKTCHGTLQGITTLH